MHSHRCASGGKAAIGFITSLSVVLSLIGSFTTSGTLAHAASRRGVPRSNIVAVRINLARAQIDEINAAFGSTTVDSIPEIPGIYLLQLPSNADAPQVVQRMVNDPRLLYAELDSIGRTPVTAHPRSISAWGGLEPSLYTEQPTTKALSLGEVHQFANGAGTTVAIIDTGVQLDHPMLAAALSESRYDFVDNDNDPSDVLLGLDEDGNGIADQAYGHGTHVAGIVHLIAPASKLMPIRALDSDGMGYMFTVAKAIAWAAHRSAAVINLSLGSGQDSRVLRDAVADARLQGAIVVAAAGNTDWLRKQYPAADTNVLGITSISDTGMKSSFANYGEWVDLAAPGENIVSTYPGSAYATWSGTSMATPFASGEAALIKGNQPNWSAAMVMALMQQCAVSLRDSDRQYQALLGAGRINPLGCWQLAASGQLKISGSK